MGRDVTRCDALNTAETICKNSSECSASIPFTAFCLAKKESSLEGCKVFTKPLMNSGWSNFTQDKWSSLANVYYLFFPACELDLLCWEAEKANGL